MKKIWIVSVILLLWCSFPAMGAEKAFESELKGDRAFARGDDSGAYRAYSQALWSTLNQAKKQAKSRSLLFAKASYYMAVISSLAKAILPNYEGLCKKLTPLLARKLPPFFRARLTRLLSALEFSQGHIKNAKKLSDSLAFIRHWALLGTFDNERGGGLNTSYPPEKKILLKKIYQGKKRKIHWRFTPVQTIFGAVNLRQMFLPHDQVLTYSLTYIHCSSKQKAIFWLATDESYKLWLNDQLVARRDLERQMTFDQDCYGVVLHKGWNKILLKSTTQTGPWAFSFRLTGTNGRPIQYRGVSSLPECLAIGYTKGFQKFSPPPSAMEILEKQAPSDPTGRLYHYLAYLHNKIRSTDKNAHTARKAWKKAIEKNKTIPLYSYYLSMVASDSAKYSVEQEENQRRFALERTLKLDPQFVPALYQLARYYFFSLRNTTKAMGFIRKILQVQPRHLPSLFLRNRIYQRKGWAIEAQLSYVKMEKQFPSAPYFLNKKADQLLGQHKLKSALKAYKKLLTQNFGLLRIRRAISGIYLKQNKPKEALSILKEWSDLFPYNHGIYLEMAHLQEGQDHIKSALKTIQKSLLINPEQDSLWIKQGQYKMELGKKAQALADLETGLKINPNNAYLRKYLKFLKRREKSFEDGYPEDVKKIVSSARKRKFSTENTAHILLDKSIIKVYPDGTSSKFTHFMAVITNEEGLREYSSYPVYYFGGEQKATIKIARVFHKDGSVEEAPTGGNNWGGGGGEFGRWLNASINLPPLKVGDIIDLQYRVDGLKQSYFGSYFGTTFYFQSEKPIDVSKLILIAPSERKLYFRAHKMAIKPLIKKNPSGTTTYIWEKHHIPKLDKEPMMAKKREVFPSVQICTFPNWKVFGKWYWNLVRKQSESSDELKKQVRQLVKGLKTPYKKIRAIYNYVVTDIRYSSEWEFGIHGYKPYSAASIYARKFGDCKDKATLINTMLKEVGILAYPVLIRGETPRSQENLSLPLVGHFNHCISYVPKQKGVPKGMFLDGTAQFHPVDNLPSMDWGARVVVISPQGGKVHTIPYPKGEENRYQSRYKIKIGQDGKATITMDFQAQRAFGVLFRSTFQNKGRWKNAWERIWGKYFGGAQVKKVSFSPLEDLNKKVGGSLILKVPKFLDKRGKKFLLPRLKEPFMEYSFGEKLTDLASKTKRKFDALLTVPTSFDLTYEIELPKGYMLGELPGKKVIQTPFGFYLYKATLEGQKLIIHKVLILKKSRISTAQYPKFRKFCQEVEKREDATLVLEPKRGVD